MNAPFKNVVREQEALLRAWSKKAQAACYKRTVEEMKKEANAKQT